MTSLRSEVVSWMSESEAFCKACCDFAGSNWSVDLGRDQNSVGGKRGSRKLFVSTDRAADVTDAHATCSD